MSFCFHYLLWFRSQSSKTFKNASLPLPHSIQWTACGQTCKRAFKFFDLVATLFCLIDCMLSTSCRILFIKGLNLYWGKPCFEQPHYVISPFIQPEERISYVSSNWMQWMSLLPVRTEGQNFENQKMYALSIKLSQLQFMTDQRGTVRTCEDFM